MKLAVAATAPFGADVLERLAARHEVAALLTRPDRPAGRGRKLARRRRRSPQSGSGSRCCSPSGRRRSSSCPAETVVVARVRPADPEALLERGLWLNVHPSLLPRWRGAAPVERAIMAGDTETGVTIHETVKELDAGPIAAQRAFPVRSEDDAGAVFARAAELAVELLDDVLPAPSFSPQEGEPTYAAKIEPADRELDLSRPEESSQPHPRAVAAHRRARRAARPPRHDLARAARGRRARPGRGAA